MKPYKIESTNYTLTLRVTEINERFPIAYASIMIVEEDGKNVGKLVGMLRRDEYKGLGICEDLVDRRIDICRELGCEKIYTAVYYKRKGLIKKYQSLGFKEIKGMTKEYRRFELIL